MAVWRYGGDDDWSIRVFILDMNDAENSGYDGPRMGDSVTLVFTSEAGTYGVGYSVLGPNDEDNDGLMCDLGKLETQAEISLSDEDNTRGYELTVAGSGFNNGATASVYVLNRAPAAGAECRDIIRNGVIVGSALVDDDDKVAVTFEVTVPTLVAGDQNYVCMVDGEGWMSEQDVGQFHLEPSVSVAPDAVVVGDTVSVFAQDFPVVGAAFTELRLAGQVVWSSSVGVNAIVVQAGSIGGDHSSSATFTMPSEVNGVVVVGTLLIDAKWGNVSKSVAITVGDAASGQPSTMAQAASGPLTAPSNLTAAPGDRTGRVSLRWAEPASA